MRWSCSPFAHQLSRLSMYLQGLWPSRVVKPTILTSEWTFHLAFCTLPRSSSSGASLTLSTLRSPLPPSLLPPSLALSLPHSLTHSLLPHSVRPSLPPSFPPSLTLSLPPSLPPFLPPSLTHSLPPSPFPPPSLLHSLPHLIILATSLFAHSSSWKHLMTSSASSLTRPTPMW